MSVRKQYYQVVKNQEIALKKMFQGLILDIVSTLSFYSGDLENSNLAVRKDVARKVNALFLTNVNNDIVPFLNAFGKIVPMSPYMGILWAHVEQSVTLAVNEHYEIIKKYIGDDPNIVFNLTNVSEFTIAEQGTFDPTRSWVSSDGYNLSDRIWKAATETRRKIDAYLDEAIRSGKSVQEIAAELEKFLIPGKSLTRTNKIYGTNASFDAVRLARTELTSAFSLSGLEAARNNPFISGYRTRRSGNGVPCAICDPIAAGGPYPLSDTEHAPALHSHCLCTMIWEIVDEPKQVKNDLQNRTNSIFDKVTPFLPQRFINYLLSFFK